MLILTIRTDKPEAEVGLFDDDKQLVYYKWQAHRTLSTTLHRQIAKNLQSIDKDWADLGAIVCYKGPGSFTGLRIGLAVGNALASGLNIPIVSFTGKNWINKGATRLRSGKNEKVAMPEYGATVHITRPKK